MDLLTNPLEKTPKLIEQYAWSLLITGDYLELEFFLARIKDVHCLTIQINHRSKLSEIATAGSSESLMQLGVAIKSYLSVLTDNQLKERIREATLQAILKILSKYFTNYSCTDLNIIWETTQDNLTELGFKIDSGYIELKR